MGMVLPPFRPDGPEEERKQEPLRHALGLPQIEEEKTVLETSSSMLQNQTANNLTHAGELDGDLLIHTRDEESSLAIGGLSGSAY